MPRSSDIETVQAMLRRLEKATTARTVKTRVEWRRMTSHWLSCFQRFHVVCHGRCIVRWTSLRPCGLRCWCAGRPWAATRCSEIQIDIHGFCVRVPGQRVPRVFGFHVPNGIATETDLNLSAWSLLPHLSGFRQIYAELWSWIRLARAPRSGKWQHERLERQRKKPMWLHNLYNHSHCPEPMNAATRICWRIWRLAQVAQKKSQISMGQSRTKCSKWTWKGRRTWSETRDTHKRDQKETFGYLWYPLVHVASCCIMLGRRGGLPKLHLFLWGLVGGVGWGGGV